MIDQEKRKIQLEYRRRDERTNDLQMMVLCVSHSLEIRIEQIHFSRSIFQYSYQITFHSTTFIDLKNSIIGTNIGITNPNIGVTDANTDVTDANTDVTYVNTDVTDTNADEFRFLDPSLSV